MYKRKWILFAVFIVTGAVILVLIHTVDRKPVTSKDPANSHTLSKISSHIRNGANFLQNKNIYGAKEVSGNEERSVFKEKYEVGISRIGEGYKSILPIGSPYNDTKNFESGKQSKHKALNYLAPTNQFLTNYSPPHEMPLSVNAKAVSQPEQKRTSIKNITQSMFLVPRMKEHRSTAEESIDKEEKTDNHLSVQSMDLKLEWLKIREERRTNEEDKLMLQKQRKLLEQQQMELEQEKIKLAEEVRRFTEYRRRLDEIHQKSRTQYEKQATLAPARTIGDLWKGLDPHEVETKYPGVQLDGDYMLRPFVDPDDPRAMGMFGNPHTIEEMTDAQAEERFYQLVSVEHVHCSDVRRMGNMGDGGWDVCVVEPFKPHLGCLIYSFGINNDFTFDDAMSETFSCDVKSFDPSMNVDDHMHSDNVLFYNLGLGSKNNITEKEWNIMTLSAILSKLGHTENTIDYLKFDIEFSEWESLKNMVHERSLANVKQLAFEIHTAEVVHVNRQSNKSDYVRWYTVLLGLEQQGFRRFHYHFNPYGRFTSLRTGRDRSCCYELYYINLKFLDTRDNG